MAPAYKNEALVNRVHELWQANKDQTAMLDTLQSEGFEIKARELMRLRQHYKWLLRRPNGEDGSRVVPLGNDNGQEAGTLQDTNTSQGELTAPAASLLQNQDGGPSVSVQTDKTETEKKLDESKERLATKKRRRRTKKYAGMPADPPGPPRYPSETTLEQSKLILGLDQALYLALRESFREICLEANVVKKTVAGPGEWEGAKTRLIEGIPHLSEVMREDADNHENKKLALDVICTDVTKRMRVTGKRITVAEAKNILCINPEESRQVRDMFYSILREGNFNGKLEAGPEHWEELKKTWLDQSDILQRALALGQEDPDHKLKTKAVDSLADEVMKRLRDDKTGRRPLKGKTITLKMPPEVEVTVVDMDSMDQDETRLDMNAVDYPVTPMSLAPGPSTPNEQMHTPMSMQLQPSPQHMPDHSPQMHTRAGLLTPSVMDSVIDHQASLMDSQMGPPMLLAADARTSYVEPQFVQHFAPPQVFQAIPDSLGVYFRLHSQSTYPAFPDMWYEAVPVHASLAQVRHTAVAKFPDALCGQVAGIIKDSAGMEVSLHITSDEEMQAFWRGHLMQQTAPTFLVQLLVRGWQVQVPGDIGLGEA